MDEGGLGDFIVVGAGERDGGQTLLRFLTERSMAFEEDWPEEKSE